VHELPVPESAIRIFAVIFAIRFLSGEAIFEHASRRGNVLVFRPVLGLRLLFGGGITLILFLLSEQGMKSGELFWDVVALGMVSGLFIVWPCTILIGPSSIRETRWFGLKRTSIPWNEVSFAGGDVENSVTVRAKDDRLIRHTQYHVDRAGFIAALKQYCENCSYNYPAPKPWVPLGAP